MFGGFGWLARAGGPEALCAGLPWPGQLELDRVWPGDPGLLYECHSSRMARPRAGVGWGFIHTATALVWWLELKPVLARGIPACFAPGPPWQDG